MSGQSTVQSADGGPAFPSGGHAYTRAVYGMSLRDWFAGQALAGILSISQPGLWIGEDYTENNLKMARVAYALADAMLSARKENPS